MNTVIKVENLSKQYRLGQVSTGTLSHDINRWWHTIRGKEDPYLKIGETNDRTTTGNSDYVWALRDINFDVKQGEVLGIIGRNGAGKSTLLKILSRTTAPTTGSIKIKGRVASLLEVGTGFHPELSGRENIFLNGAILGMTRNEIKRKFDDIVAFAGVERYIDTPVKRYSSGMYVRLAFAVAAHLEPEILIVDEVLAVGDAEFQKKCIGKMKDVSEKEGRTVLYVSHQLGTIVNLCKRAILLKNGTVVKDGIASAVVDHYVLKSDGVSNNGYVFNTDTKKDDCYFEEITLINSKSELIEEVAFNEKIKLRIKINHRKFSESVLVGIGINDKFGTRVCTFIKPLNELTKANHLRTTFSLEIPSNIIAPNQYSFVCALFVPGRHPVELIENVCSFLVVDSGTEYSIFEGVDYGNIIITPKWVNDEEIF
ncbi:MAG: ABC transporter ATP-binding protein [Sphingobacteriales bacterium]|nr:ABC transporter ATP-binding protein [Sphingobacteriales bacterium]MBI3718046.1 ABC transporter ATP-binding protein [Sphingobacteriales bacterium]